MQNSDFMGTHDSKIKKLLWGILLLSLLEVFIKIYFEKFLIENLFFKTYVWLDFREFVVLISCQLWVVYIILHSIKQVSGTKTARIAKSLTYVYIACWVYIMPAYKVVFPTAFLLIMSVKKINEL